MRQREFQFLTINTSRLWKQKAEKRENIQIAGGALCLKQEWFYAKGEPLPLPHGKDIVDFAMAETGLLYLVLKEKNQVRTYDPDTKDGGELECLSQDGNTQIQFCHPEAIALGADLLYIADTGNNRVLAFDRTSFRLRWEVDTSDDAQRQSLNLSNPMKPVALDLDEAENLYVLDPANGRVLKFGKGCKLPQRFPSDSSLIENSNLTAVTHLAVQGNHLYVLGTTKNSNGLLSLDAEKSDSPPRSIGLPDDLLDDSEPWGIAVDKEGYIYIGDKKFLSDGQDEDRFIRRFREGSQQSTFVPGFVGKCRQFHFDKEKNLHVLNDEGVITPLKRTERFERKGTYISSAFDSGRLGLQWHRLVMAADIPDETQVKVSYYISDAVKRPSSAKWSKLPVNPIDALILSERGRYLWLKIELFGDEEHTPTIQSLRVYFPRRSYLRYLPAVYQADAASQQFLEQFLSLFETFFFKVEEKISNMTTYFDIDATPFGRDAAERNFLTWLSSWLGVGFDENWTEPRKRRLLKELPDLYKKRGTREGLKTFLEIFTDREVIIVEPFQLNAIKHEETKTIWSELLADNQYAFIVLLSPVRVKYQEANADRSARCPTEATDELNTIWGIIDAEARPVKEVTLCLTEAINELNTVYRIIEAEKPAHTHAVVDILPPGAYLNRNSYIGVNTVLIEPESRLGETSVIGQDRILSD